MANKYASKIQVLEERTIGVSKPKGIEDADQLSSGFDDEEIESRPRERQWLLQLLDIPRENCITFEMVGLKPGDRANLFQDARNGDSRAIRKVKFLKEFISLLMSERNMITERKKTTYISGGKLVTRYRKIRRPRWVVEAVESKKHAYDLDVKHGHEDDYIRTVMEGFEDWFEKSRWLDFREVQIGERSPYTRDELIQSIKDSTKYQDSLVWAAEVTRDINRRLDSEAARPVEAEVEELAPLEAGSVTPQSKVAKAGLAEIRSWSAVNGLQKAELVKYCRALHLSQSGNNEEMRERVAKALGIKAKAWGRAHSKQLKEVPPPKDAVEAGV